MKAYIVDAFTDHVFGGNPAGVCVLDKWLDDGLMQSIAIENNLSETAFTVKEKDGFALRWFTPGGEIDLCGHATLATSFVLSQRYYPEVSSFSFSTRSGILNVEKKGEFFEMVFPNWKPHTVELSPAMRKAAGVDVSEAFLCEDLILMTGSEAELLSAKPDFDAMRALPEGLGFIMTAAGTKADFVSRCFYPKLKVNEDPVTGRAHCSLIPLWAERLNKNKLFARQISPRGGDLYCECGEKRVKIAGKAVMYAESELFI